MPTPGANRKVLVAMSGGVDSSVAAALLQRQGYSVVGCFMRLGSEDGLEAVDPVACDPAKVKAHHQGCCSVNDAGDARFVAAMLGVPFYVLNFRRDFDRVIDYFVGEYNAGRTPNPCVRCNDWLKFGKLADYAKSIDADFVASGHYARTGRDASTGRMQLLRGVDHQKDQSYVLFGTKRDALEHLLLPIGGYEKSVVRAMAKEWGLPVFDKPDSQEICFVPDNDYAGLIERRTPEALRPGAIVDTTGRVLGEHAGQQRFTIGQRRGIGVSAPRGAGDAESLPLYVIDKDAATGTVTVGSRDELFSVGLFADQTNWLADAPPVGTWVTCTVKIRYNSPPAPARLRLTGPDALEVQFDQPLSAVTPGQAVVCYDGERVFGGGWIQRAIRGEPSPDSA